MFVMLPQKNSLMATNRGILATLRYYWGEIDHQHGDFSVEKLLKTGETSLAVDYYRKLCATCHLWKQKGDMEGFFGEKGGGCTACHSIRPQAPRAERPWETWLAFGREKQKPHPLITRKVPMENCIRCHNRSGRVGTSYIGVYEGENYGTPHEEGTLSSKRLPGDRFYLDLPNDIHHQQGMSCIDCHTKEEVMGDGNAYAHYEEALEAFLLGISSPIKEIKGESTCWLGKTYWRLGKVEEALSAFTKATLQGGKIAALAYVEMGNIYSELGRSEEARLAYQEALKYAEDEAMKARVTKLLDFLKGGP